MLNLQDIKKKESKYQLYFVNKSGIKEEVGIFRLGCAPKKDHISVWGEKISCYQGFDHQEEFDVLYTPCGNIKNIQIKGMASGKPYSIAIEAIKEKLEITANLVQGKKKLSIKKPATFYEFNTFPFLLPLLLESCQVVECQTFIPSSAAFMDTKVTKLAHIEQIELPIGGFQCYRVKVEVPNNDSGSQFLVYCKKSGLLIKGSSASQLFELIE